MLYADRDVWEGRISMKLGRTGAANDRPDMLAVCRPDGLKPRDETFFLELLRY